MSLLSILLHAHTTKYIMYGSLMIYSMLLTYEYEWGTYSYRVVVHEWLKELGMQDPIWRGLQKRLKHQRLMINLNL